MTTSHESPPPPRQQQASDIRKLSGLEHLRTRPGMYVGATPNAIYHMLYIVLDYSVNEAMAGYCTHIELVIHADSSVTISDNSRGLPVDVHPHIPLSKLELELTQMMIGGAPKTHPHMVRGGRHGVGLKAVNALSEWLIAEVRRDGYVWRQSYSRGDITSEFQQVRPLNESEATGNSLTFFIDNEIFSGVRKDYDFNFEVIAERCRELAYLLHGVTIHLIDERQSGMPREVTFYFENGLTAYINHLNRGFTPLHDTVTGTSTLQFNRWFDEQHIFVVDFALQYTSNEHTIERSFVNTVETTEGGTHLTGVRIGVTNAVKHWMNKTDLPEKATVSNRDILQGLTAVISLKHPNPQFESMTTIKLMNPEVVNIVAPAVSTVFGEFLRSNRSASLREYFSTLAHR